MVAGTVVGVVPPSMLNLDSPFIASSADRWVNGLWFVSLTFSLATALLSVLVKQWMQAYISPIFGTPHFQSRVRHFRYVGMQEWHVPLITGMLPILLHLALLLFFAGLIVLLFTLDHIIAAFVTGIGIVAYTAYLGTNLLPIWYSQCPYKTPLSRYAYITVHTIGPTFRKRYRQLHWLAHSVTSAMPPLPTLVLRHSRLYLYQITSALSVLCDLYLTHVDVAKDSEESLQQHMGTLQLMEHADVEANGQSLDAQMFGWLCDMSANPSVRAVVVAAVSDLEIGFSGLETLRTGILRHTCAALGDCLRSGDIIPGKEGAAYVCLRAHMQLGPGKPTLTKQLVNGSRKVTDCSCYIYVNRLSFVEPRMEALGYFGVAESVARIYGAGGDSQIPNAHDLRQLRPPASSKRAWILLLRRALLASMKTGSVNARLTFIVERDGPTLAFWLTQPPLSQLTITYPDHFTVLEGVLLAAYLFQWTRPGGANLEHHPLLHAALHDVEHLAIRKTIEESRQRPGKNQLHDLIAYYRAHIRIHILFQYTHAHHQQDRTLVSLSKRLTRSGELSSPIFRYIFSFRPPAIAVPDNHPLLDQLQYLIPTPNSVHALLQAWTNDTPTLSRVLKTVINISRFLLQAVKHEEINNVVKRHDLLAAFYIVTERQASLSRGLNRVTDSVAMYWTGSALRQSFSSSANPRHHLDYIRSHLVGLCTRALAEWVYAHQQKNERTTFNVDSHPRPLLWCLGDLAQFMAGVSEREEYQRTWDEAIQTFSKSMHREEQRDCIEPFVDKLVSWSLRRFTICNVLISVYPARLPGKNMDYRERWEESCRFQSSLPRQDSRDRYVLDEIAIQHENGCALHAYREDWAFSA